MGITFWLTIAIFLVTFILIMTDKIPIVISAMGGGFLMVLLHLMSEEAALKSIDIGIILLLVGMMMIVHITSETGIFQWLAIKIGQTAKGNPVVIMAMLIICTALLSAFLDNVTTVLLIAPVSVMIALQLEISPVPFLLAEAMASNIGGTATLIGDPPNILIGTQAGLGFNEFIIHATPVIIINLIVFTFTMILIFGKKMNVTRDLKVRVMEIDSSRAIKDKRLLIKSLTVLGIVVIGFFVSRIVKISPAIIAISGATLLLAISKKKPAEVLKHMEWETIFFFIGLFVVVQGVVEVGAIKILADNVVKITGGSLSFTAMLILWVSGVLSSVVNNVPYAQTMIPLIKDGLIPGILSVHPELAKEAVANALWWPLVLGACLGGNGTLVGASANVICAGIGSKEGYKISFVEFTKYGMIVMIESMIISTIYIWIRYLN